MRWQIEIQGDETPWTTAIETQLKWKKTEGLSWWTAWGDSRPDAPKAHGRGPTLGSNPLPECLLSYGSRHFTQPQAISFPLVTVLAPEMDRGSVWSCRGRSTVRHESHGNRNRRNGIRPDPHRISPDHPIRFAMDLVIHEADWRAGLAGWSSGILSTLTHPIPRPMKSQGAARTRAIPTDFDAERLMRMAFRINWKASFDFPYMGMFIPPVPDERNAVDGFQEATNIDPPYARDIRAFTAQGLHVLNYFNVTEFGALSSIRRRRERRKRTRICGRTRMPFCTTSSPAPSFPKTSPANRSILGRLFAMDPGDPVYQQFLLDQAKRHIEVFPESSGICIDRMDWLQYFNPRFDDGLSWVDGKPRVPCRVVA